MLRSDREIDQKGPFAGKGSRPEKLLRDNAGPRVAASIEDALRTLDWKVSGTHDVQSRHGSFRLSIVPISVKRFVRTHTPKHSGEAEKRIRDFIASSLLELVN